jgi:hypothetical protein
LSHLPPRQISLGRKGRPVAFELVPPGLIKEIADKVAITRALK